MGTLPNYKEIVELLKKGADVEDQEKIMKLRETAIDLKEENVSQPFCPNCWENDKKAIHLLRGDDRSSCPNVASFFIVVELTH